MALALLASSPPQSKPVREVSLHEEPYFVPQSLDDLVIKSDLIIRATVAETRAADLNFKSPEGIESTLVRTAFRYVVTEVIKTDDLSIRPGVLVEVLRRGGIRDKQSYLQVTKVDALVPPKVHEDNLLFLRRDRSGTLEPSAGDSNSTFELRAGKVITQSKVEQLRSVVDVTANALVAEIRRKVSR